MSARLKLFFALLILSALAGAYWGDKQVAANPKLVFLAVGQGDSALWMEGGHGILIDAGPKTREGFDAGARIVLPKLRKMGVGNLSAIIITHPDADHIGGLKAVAQRFRSAKVILSAGFQENDEMRWWLREAQIDSKRILWVDQPVRLRLKESTLDVVAPPVSESTNDNDGSLFVRIERGPASAVLTGDASMTLEESMQNRLGWSGQVLKVGHHGSRTSTSEMFLKKLKPKWAVISCGRDNRFGHPHPSVLEVLERQKVGLFRTDLQGDVVFEAGRKGFLPLAAK